MYNMPSWQQWQLKEAVVLPVIIKLKEETYCKQTLDEEVIWTDIVIVSWLTFQFNQLLGSRLFGNDCESEKHKSMKNLLE